MGQNTIIILIMGTKMINVKKKCFLTDFNGPNSLKTAHNSVLEHNWFYLPQIERAANPCQGQKQKKKHLSYTT